VIPHIEKIQALGNDIWTRFVFGGNEEKIHLDAETQKSIKTYLLKRLCSRITEDDCCDCHSYNRGYSDAVSHIIGGDLEAMPTEKLYQGKQIDFNEYTRGWFCAKQDVLLLSVKPPTKPQPRNAQAQS